jgi:hypothetical protein
MSKFIWYLNAKADRYLITVHRASHLSSHLLARNAEIKSMNRASVRHVKCRKLHRNVSDASKFAQAFDLGRN